MIYATLVSFCVTLRQKANVFCKKYRIEVEPDANLLVIKTQNGSGHFVELKGKTQEGVAFSYMMLIDILYR